MTIPTKITIDAVTGAVTEIELSGAELDAYNAAVAQKIASDAAAAAAAAADQIKSQALEQYKDSIRREAKALEDQGLYVESFLKLKTIGE